MFQLRRQYFLLKHQSSREDIELIKSIIQKYPGKTPVHMTLRNSLGNRVCIELGERYCVSPSAKLDEELSLYS